MANRSLTHLNSSSWQVSGKSLLKVDKATLDVAGMFSVKVTNKAGEVEEKVKVTVD